DLGVWRNLHRTTANRREYPVAAVAVHRIRTGRRDRSVRRHRSSHARVVSRPPGSKIDGARVTRAGRSDVDDADVSVSEPDLHNDRTRAATHHARARGSLHTHTAHLRVDNHAGVHAGPFRMGGNLGGDPPFRTTPETQTDRAGMERRRTRCMGWYARWRLARNSPRHSILRQFGRAHTRAQPHNLHLVLRDIRDTRRTGYDALSSSARTRPASRFVRQ